MLRVGETYYHTQATGSTSKRFKITRQWAKNIFEGEHIDIKSPIRYLFDSNGKAIGYDGCIGSPGFSIGPKKSYEYSVVSQPGGTPSSWYDLEYRACFSESEQIVVRVKGTTKVVKLLNGTEVQHFLEQN